MKVVLNRKTNSHLLIANGINVGFTNTEWYEGTLILIYGEFSVASIEGDTLKEFLNLEYVIKNKLD